MEIFANLGFNYKLFFSQIVNFLVLFFIFKKFLYGPILRVLKERDEKIKKGLEDSDKAKLMLDSVNKESTEIIKNARVEAQGILEEVKNIADSMRVEIINKSKKESEEILLQAKQNAGDEMKKMEKSVKTMSLDLSGRILNSSLKDIFTEEEKQKILQRALERMEQDKRF